MSGPGYRADRQSGPGGEVNASLRRVDAARRDAMNEADRTEFFLRQDTFWVWLLRGAA